MPALYLFSLDRHTTRKGLQCSLLYYTAVIDDTPRVVVPDHDDLRLRIMLNFKMRKHMGFVAVRRLISRSVVTFTGPPSISSGTSTSDLEMSVSR